MLAFSSIAALFVVSSAEAQQDAVLSQFKATVDPSPKERTGAPSASPEARLEDYLEDRGASPETVESLALESDHVAPDGKRFVKFEQRIDDLRVHGGFSKAAFDENGALIHVMERLAPADAGVALALITPAEALGIALDRNFPDAPVPALAHEQGAISTFAADPHFYQAPTVEMVVVAEGAYLEEGFLVVLWGAADNRLYHTVVNGTGDIVENELRTTYAVPPSSSCPAVGSAVTIPINWGMRKGPLSTPTGKCGKGPGLCTISGGSTGTITGAPCIKNGASWWLIDVPGQCAGYVRQDFFDCQASPPPPNNLPTANITTDKTSGDAPLTVNFDGTGSTDDGQIVSYEWDFDGNGTIDATGATASFTYQTSGTYTARLTVTDDEGGKDEATTVITVESPPPNIPPTAQIVSNKTSGDSPLPVTFDASGSTDSDGHIVSYDWDFEGDGTTVSAGAIASFTYQTAGNYSARLTVTDDDGATDDATIYIVVDNEPPTAVIAADKTSGDAPLTVSFDGTGSTDSDGLIVAYDWDFDDDGTTDATGASASFTYQAEGTYTARLTVTDDDGATDDATTAISVNPAPQPGGCPAVGAAVIIPNNWGMRKGPASTPSGGCGKGPGICTISGGSTGTITGDPCVKSGANWWLISVPGQCEGYVRENYFACQ